MGGLTNSLRAIFAFHKERFEAAFEATDKPFRIELGKYVDNESFNFHWNRLWSEPDAYLRRVAMMGGSDEHTICGAGESWKADDSGEEEFATLIGSKPVVDKFKQLAGLAGMDLPFDVIPNVPFHEFDSWPKFVFREHCGVWIEFVFHQLRTPEERHFDCRIDWPKVGCRITKLIPNPFLASARAIQSLLAATPVIPADDRPNWKVTTNPPQVTFDDDDTEVLTPDCATFLRAMLDAYPDWIAASKLDIGKPKRTAAAFPARVRDRLESESGKGYRIRPA